MPRAAVLLAIAAGLCLGQDFADLNVAKLLTGYRFPSSPVWSRDGYWLLTDAPLNHVIQALPGEKPELYLDQAQGASGLAIDAQGRVYVCEARARRVVRIDKKKRLESVAEKWQGKRLNAPNKIAVRKDGNAYFTDPAFGYQQDTRELDFYGVYRITPKGELELVAKSSTRPNGIALSPNGRMLYVSDSDRRSVRAYDLDRAGAASNERVFIARINGVPSGMCVDEKGNLYVGARNLELYSPDAKHIRSVEFTNPPSGCGFGDPDLQSIWVTSGGSVYRLRLKVKGASQN